MPRYKTPKTRIHSYYSFLVCLVLIAASFYAGVFVGVYINKPAQENDKDCWAEDDPRLAKFLKRQLDKKLREQQQQQNNIQAVGTSEETWRVPQERMGQVVTGMGRVDRDAFATNFDMGVPLDESKKGNQEVLLLYNGLDALPSNAFDAEQSKSAHQVPLLLSVEEATENCKQLHIVLTQPGRSGQCVALMGQYESFHVQKFMRLPEQGKIDPSAPMRLVNRGAQENGNKSTKPPTRAQTLQHWDVLAKYLRSMPGVLNKLKPIVQQLATNNAVVVMVCNFGQSELLMNFVCNAKAKGLDISSVLVFCTDIETQELAESLGLAIFYDETIFERMPKNAAKRYADNNFMAMMGAKVYCVQLVSLLGYDVLFQDVDVVWYTNPLPWFHNTSSPLYNFDIYFQDDGNHALFYAPYSANTGFYYVRHNDKTQYFFNSLLLAGDLILSTHSHQIALIALLNEHASMYGLKVKIFERNTQEFPGGFSFHRKKDFMKDMLQDRVKPYIFHMSWTLNKDNKEKYYRQMGEWYLQDTCVGKPLSEIGGADAVFSRCCAAKPNIACYYRDKPSKIPCRESPPIDKGKPSFW